MFIRKFKNIINENKEIKKENEKLNENIIKARQEISWLKMILEMNRYGDPNHILSMASRKIDEIEEILEKD